MAQSTIVVLNGTSRVNRHIIQQALAKGHRVRAIVRSTSRFYAQTKKHDDLSAHEWSDFSDLAPLASILDGADVIYVALCAPASDILKPTWLNAEAVTSICTVLRDQVAPGSRCATKLILLSAMPARPGERRNVVGEAFLGHQFNDLRTAHSFLVKQQGWLDVAYLVPGLILDSESSSDAASIAAVELQEGGLPHGPISYARLAAAMQLAAADPRWIGKFALPVNTTTVPKGLKYMGGPLEGLQVFLTRRILPSLGKTLALVAVGSGIGYVIGCRDGGAWALRTLGVNVKAR